MQSLFTTNFAPMRMGVNLRDLWSDARDRYNETFNPEVKPAATTTTAPKPASAPADSGKVFGIPQNYLLWGGVTALGLAAAVAIYKNR